LKGGEKKRHEAVFSRLSEEGRGKKKKESIVPVSKKTHYLKKGRRRGGMVHSDLRRKGAKNVERTDSRKRRGSSIIL